MSASLVGSEMCIRDSVWCGGSDPPHHPRACCARAGWTCTSITLLSGAIGCMSGREALERSMCAQCS
eukprot:7391340-Alexandrium_andersonii.AAC.1